MVSLKTAWATNRDPLSKNKTKLSNNKQKPDEYFHKDVYPMSVYSTSDLPYSL
jgi:hypothetical protein